jgi:hypothetical protein
MSGSEQELEIASLRELICKTFPAETFEGMITPADGDFTEELDEEKDLYETLRNAKWPDVAASFIHANPDGYVLLTDAAYAAFLPAWLSQSLDTEKDNRVREFVSYAFSPSENMASDTSLRIANRFQQLDLAQRATLHTVLKHLAKYEPSDFIKNHAERAVAFIENLSQQ